MVIKIKSSYDNNAKNITHTIIISAIILLILSQLAFQEYRIFLLGLSVLILLITIIVFLYSPRGYLIKDRTLKIKRIIGNIEVPLEKIIDVKIINYNGIKRLIGSEGHFGYFGKYYSQSYGEIKLIAKSKEHLLLLYLSDKNKIVISIDNLEDIKLFN